ncbi:MAG: hypothetical protein OXL96_18575 [Candidatus Poribacteria bacterium]|nr:hypothetical protein [Candidatus Poribacteria bacterium]
MSDISGGRGLEFLNECYEAVRNYNATIKYHSDYGSTFSKWLVRMAKHELDEKETEFDRLVNRMDIDPEADPDEFIADSE